MCTKKLRFNMVSVLMVVMLLMLMAAFTEHELGTAESRLNQLGMDISDMSGAEEIDDVAGYGIILGGIGYGAGWFGIFVVRLIFVYVPVFFAAYLLFFAVMARLLYRVRKAGILLYRLSMGAVYLGILVLLVITIAAFFAVSMPGKVFVLAFAAGLLFVFCRGICNTYGRQRICESVSSDPV